MEWYFYFVPGTIASIVAVGSCYYNKRCGTVAQELQRGLPILMIINVVCILTSSPNDCDIRNALFTIPFGVAAEGMLLLSWKILPKLIRFGNSFRNTKLSLLILCSLVFWSLPMLLCYAVYPFIGAFFPFIGIGAVGVAFLLGVGLTFCEANHMKTYDIDEEEDIADANFKVLSIRAVVAFVTASLCNLCASLGIGVLAGFICVFPSLLSVSMSQLWLIYGIELEPKSPATLLIGCTGTNMFVMITAWLYLDEKRSEDQFTNITFSVGIACVAAVLIGVAPLSLFKKYTQQRREDIVPFLKRISELQEAAKVPRTRKPSSMVFDLDSDLEND